MGISSRLSSSLYLMTHVSISPIIHPPIPFAIAFPTILSVPPISEHVSFSCQASDLLRLDVSQVLLCGNRKGVCARPSCTGWATNAFLCLIVFILHSLSWYSIIISIIIVSHLVHCIPLFLEYSLLFLSRLRFPPLRYIHRLHLWRGDPRVFAPYFSCQYRHAHSEAHLPSTRIR